ncbi:hypothetical protein HPB47_010348, partial [Ixodes persulcatus]
RSVPFNASTALFCEIQISVKYPFKYVLLETFKSHCLENRIGRYRQLCGAQYHISNRQTYENTCSQLYVAGYCVHAALKKLMCPFCKENLVVDNRSLEIGAEELIQGVTRGVLNSPQSVVVNDVLAMNIMLEKLSSERKALKLYSCENQNQKWLVLLTTPLVEYNEDLDVCENSHLPHVVTGYVLSAAANTLLNNFCKQENNILAEAKA